MPQFMQDCVCILNGITCVPVSLSRWTGIDLGDDFAEAKDVNWRNCRSRRCHVRLIGSKVILESTKCRPVTHTLKYLGSGCSVCTRTKQAAAISLLLAVCGKTPKSRSETCDLNNVLDV